MAPSDSKDDTKTLIMDTAERMIAERGINGVSNRAILSEAGVNSAALHYHFNSRDELIKAMIARYGRIPIEKRRELIREFDASGREPTIADVVDIIVDPMISLLVQHGESGRRFYRFIARIQYDRTGLGKNEESEYLPETNERLGAILREIGPGSERSKSDLRTTIEWLGSKLRDVCPGVDSTELDLRMTIVIDTLLQSLSNADFMAREWDGTKHNDQLQLFAKQLKSFLAAGLGAPATH